MLASGNLLRWQTLIIARASGEEHIISTACLKICAALLQAPESVIFPMDWVSHSLFKIHIMFHFITMITQLLMFVFFTSLKAR